MVDTNLMMELENKDGEIWVNSQDVAENFGRRHCDLLRAINDLKADLSTPQFCVLFKNGEYIAANGKKNKMYFMTRDGFSLLVMGFTGRKALNWKVKYIEAFNTMEERLKSGDTLTDEERLKLQLFSKDAAEVAAAHNKLVDMAVDKATAPLIPKAEFCDAVAVSENSISFGKFAGEFQNGSGKSFGRNRIMAFCRNKGYLCKDTHLLNKPMQRMIDSGYMQYLVSTRRNGANKIYTTYTPMLTGKGQIWLTKELTKTHQRNLTTYLFLERVANCGSFLLERK